MEATTKQAAGTAAEHIAAAPSAKSLDFVVRKELEALRERALRENPAGNPGTARAKLVNYPDLRITLVYLAAGARIEEHYNPGRIVVHAVAGHLRMHAAEKTFDLPSGALLALDRAVPHDVEALEESAFLLTVVPRVTHAG